MSSTVTLSPEIEERLQEMAEHLALYPGIRKGLEETASRHGQEPVKYIVTVLKNALMTAVTASAVGSSSPAAMTGGAIISAGSASATGQALPAAMSVSAQDSDRPKRSLLELKGLGASLWNGIDIQEYVDALRNEWDTAAPGAGRDTADDLR